MVQIEAIGKDDLLTFLTSRVNAAKLQSTGAFRLLARESVCVSESERERESVCVCVCECVCEREIYRVCERVCVCVSAGWRDGGVARKRR